MFQYERPRGGAGVYWLYSHTGQLLYIGAGWEPAYRWRDHAKKKDWWPDVDMSRTKLEWFPNYRDALAREKVAIKADKPLHNMTYSTTRPHWSAGRPRAPRPRTVPVHRTKTFRALKVSYLGVQAARTEFRRIVDDALTQNTATVIERHGQPVAAVVPYEWLQRAERALAAEEARPTTGHDDSTSSR